MTTTTITSEPTTVDPSSGFSDFILHRLHVAGLRAKIIANEFDAIGIALRDGLIDTEGALAMLDEGGLLTLIEASS